MHDIEPHWNWRNIYSAEEDRQSPFYGRQYSEFEFTDSIYDHVIHPQWDNIGSSTLFIKLLYVDYPEGSCIMELIGEWNDLLYNDIMILKRNIVDHLLDEGINKFVLIGENILNFHSSDDCYYEEWFDDVEEGWIALINFRDHVLADMEEAQIDHFFVMGGKLNAQKWRTLPPDQFLEAVEKQVIKRISLS